jgi:hypothetical protein
MKASNILMTTATLIILSSMVLYDFALKAEYLRMKELGENKQANRFGNYEQAAFKDFSSIEFKAANAFSISVEYGEKEAVWIKKKAKVMITVNKVGNNLIVDLSKEVADLSKEGKLLKYYSKEGYDMVIICPHLNKVNTEAFTCIRTNTDIKKETTTTIKIETTTNYNGLPMEIRGFEQDSLHLSIADNTKLTLNKNRFKYVNAFVGGNKGPEQVKEYLEMGGDNNPFGEGGTLSIGADNNINSLKLTVQGKSSVEVLDTDIQNFEHHISDSAKVTFSGISLQKFSKDF